MNDRIRAGFVALVLLAGAVPAARSADPPCEPGFRWVEEQGYKEVVHHVCKLVPGTKKVKKIVYTTKEDPFCRRKCGLKELFGRKDGCGEGPCLKCKGPHRRTILVKTEITCDEPIMKCVAEKVVETVPCIVRRKVPCDVAPIPSGVLLPPIAPGRPSAPPPVE